MNVLHISLGIPPYRTGGLTKYSYDLMNEQVKIGYNVSLLSPGPHSLSKAIRIVKRKSHKVDLFEIINPLPVPLLGGISEIESFLKYRIDKNIYLSFLKELNPDVIHFHSFMGIHKELLETAKKLGIRMVYTSHDYYGLCPKVNLINYKNELCNDYREGEECCKCNTDGNTLSKMCFMQSRFVKYLKCSKLRLYLKNANANLSIGKKPISTYITKAKEYRKFRNYYLDMFRMIDYYHFNSSISQEEYQKYLDVEGRVINISHADIIDARILKKYSNENTILNIGFIGGSEAYKGLPLLIESLKDMLKRGIENWHLNVYGLQNYDIDCHLIKHITFYGRYRYADLKRVFMDMDIFIIPSTWRETFGFVGLEALSYGIPLVVTNNVGLKDIIEKKQVGFIIDPTVKDIANVLTEIIVNRKTLLSIQENIRNMKFDFEFSTHVKKIVDLYKYVLEREK